MISGQELAQKIEHVTNDFHGQLDDLTDAVRLMGWVACNAVSGFSQSMGLQPNICSEILKYFCRKLRSIQRSLWVIVSLWNRVDIGIM